MFGLGDVLMGMPFPAAGGFFAVARAGRTAGTGAVRVVFVVIGGADGLPLVVAPMMVAGSDRVGLFRSAAAKTKSGGVTPLSRAHASFCLFVMQQQWCQHWSAEAQPQGRFWHG